MNEVTLKGMFIKELFKGGVTTVHLFYSEQAGGLSIGTYNDEDIEYKRDCSIKVIIQGDSKRISKQRFIYGNHLHLKECNYIDGVEK